MLLWNKWRCSYLPNVIVALQPLKRKFCWVLWSFLISSVIENLNSVSLQKTADLFPEHEPQGSFRLFFQCRILFLQCRKHSTVAATNSTLYVVNHHATRGYIAYHVGSAIKELWRTKRTSKKDHTSYLFISFWQSALAKYALELGHHTICEESSCCVQ